MADVKQNLNLQEEENRNPSQGENSNHGIAPADDGLPEVEIIETIPVDVDDPLFEATQTSPPPEDGERIKNLLEGNQKYLKDIENLKTEILRARADYENLKKRTARERFEEIKRAKKSLLVEFLEVMDNFERALQTEDKTDSNFIQGVEMISKQLKDVFSQNHVYEIKAENTSFDPQMHDAMLHQPSDDYPEGTVIQVFKKGYTFNGELLRPSQVSVAAPPPVIPEQQEEPVAEQKD
jgi:molecular chaperone GrpE